VAAVRAPEMRKHGLDDHAVESALFRQAAAEGIEHDE
jgi:hypothetical protein